MPRRYQIYLWQLAGRLCTTKDLVKCLILTFKFSKGHAKLFKTFYISQWDLSIGKWDMSPLVSLQIALCFSSIMMRKITSKWLKPKTSLTSFFDRGKTLLWLPNAKNYSCRYSLKCWKAKYHYPSTPARTHFSVGLKS